MSFITMKKALIALGICPSKTNNNNNLLVNNNYKSKTNDNNKLLVDNKYTYKESLENIGNMTYSDFTLFIDKFEDEHSDQIVEVLHYWEFSVYGVKDRYFYINHINHESDDFYEVELVAERKYLGELDLREYLALGCLFENDCCGKIVTSYGLKCLWFKAVKE